MEIRLKTQNPKQKIKVKSEILNPIMQNLKILGKLL